MSRIAVYAPVGRFDSSNSRLRQTELMAILAEGEGSVLIDFSRVEFLSSAGLRVLLLAANESNKQGGALHLSGARPSVREVLVVSGFQEILTLLD